MKSIQFLCQLRNAQHLAKNHLKNVKLSKVLDNDGHLPTASVGNDTSILKLI